ncbi:MAG TPA: hypothetical protein PLY87_13030 [Planctomycetaceae bacterium]|nr:hypothetical protein [Planctomycetaceae bacterium]HQZ66002.1 hypothetical protein [Planctomycetaceae bacterium]
MAPYCSPLDGAGLHVRPTQLYTYDAVGNVLTTQDYLSPTFGRTTTQKYDYLNRLIQVVSPPAFVTTSGAPSEDQFVVNYGYDKVGNQTSVTETTTASGSPLKTTTYLYDHLNRLVQTIAPNPVTGAASGGPVSSSSYDLAGRMLTSTVPIDPSTTPANRSKWVTTYSYDELDRVTGVVGPDPNGPAAGNSTDLISSETRYYFNASGLLDSTQTRRNPDPMGVNQSSAGVFSTTYKRYDALDRLTSVIDANGGVTQYRYDNDGNRIQLTDALFNTTRWQYDAQGHLVAETDPRGMSTVSEFDLAGNLSAVTDRRGYRTQYVRDGLDRVIREQWLQSATNGTSFVSQFESWYDNYGRLSWVQQRTATTSALTTIAAYAYDELDRVTSRDAKTTAGQNAAILSYVYDVSGNQTQRTQQTGTGSSQVTVTTNYTGYDYLNRVPGLNQSATGFTGWQDKSVRLQYNADSSLQALTRYSDLTQTNIVVTTAYVYDFAGRLSSLTHSKPAPVGDLPISYSYKYYADGHQLQEVTTLDGTASQNYDDFG